jgi:pyrimidine oxygenase
MIIADETDEAAFAKWEHYKAGTDFEAMYYRDNQAGNDATADKEATIRNFAASTEQKLPSAQNVLIGSYARIAAMLDEMAAVPGVAGAMLTFDDFVIGMEQFGTRIQPLMQSRRDMKLAA